MFDIAVVDLAETQCSTSAYKWRHSVSHKPDVGLCYAQPQFLRLI
jgi:hypothetical protein